MNENNFDYERLRRELIDYFETAMVNVSFMAVSDLTRIERASDEELLKIAMECGVDLNKYLVGYRNYTY